MADKVRRLITERRAALAAKKALDGMA